MLVVTVGASISIFQTRSQIDNAVITMTEECEKL
jgi:hypothetical protein